MVYAQQSEKLLPLHSYCGCGVKGGICFPGEHRQRENLGFYKVTIMLTCI